MSMGQPRRNMGRVDWIGVESVGVPGQRTFRLLVYANGEGAYLWLEKEQLQELAEELARMIVQIDTERVDTERANDVLGSTRAAPQPKPPGFPANPAVDLHVGELGLRYDPQRDLILLEAADREAPEDSPPAVRCLATRDQMESLQASSLEVISAGRPRCPLCGTPLSSPGMPHFCPPTNGHQKLEEDE